MRRTSIKDRINEPWLIAPDDENYVISAELKSTAGMNMTFETEDHLILGSLFHACPNDLQSAPPDQLREQIAEHPAFIRGEVLREDGSQVYKIRVVDNRAVKLSASLSESKHHFDEDGFRLIVEAHGSMNMAQFIKLVNQIKQRAVSALRILLDFSHLHDIPPTAPALMRDLLKHFVRNHRITAMVGCEKHCEHMASQLKPSPYVKLFVSRDEAEQFFQDDPIRILIVEDDPATQTFISAFIEERGLKPTCVSSAEEGIESAKAEQPDLILMDIHLPGMNGLDAIHAIRSDHSLHQTAIIVITGDASEGTVLAGRNAGINGYFLKPFNPEKFTQTIFKALEDAFEDEL